MMNYRIITVAALLVALPAVAQKKKTVAIIGTGLSATYLATQNLGVRFSTDYDVAPPVVRSSRERLHKLTFSMEVCAVF